MENVDKMKISSIDSTSLTLVDRLNILIGEEPIAAFARRIGISNSLLRKYLEGSQPGADNLSLIAKACGCTLDWLIDGTQPMFRSGNIAFDLDPTINPSDIIWLVKTYNSATSDQKVAIRLLIKAIEQPGAKAWFELGNSLTKIANIFPSRKKKAKPSQESLSSAAISESR